MYYSQYKQDKFLDKIVKHYKKLSKGFGMEMKPDEELINSYGYQFMNMKQLKKSEQFFKLNVTNYPESFNVYDSLGDYYVKIGDKKRAIINFRKAISLNSKSEESIKKLNELEKE